MTQYGTEVVESPVDGRPKKANVGELIEGIGTD